MSNKFKPCIELLTSVFEGAINRNGEFYPNDYVKPIGYEEPHEQKRTVQLDTHDLCANFMQMLEAYEDAEVIALWDRLIYEMDERITKVRNDMLISTARTLRHRQYSDGEPTEEKQRLRAYRINHLEHEKVRLAFLNDEGKRALEFACGLEDRQLMTIIKKTHREKVKVFKELLNLLYAIYAIDMMHVNHRTKFLILNGYPYLRNRGELTPFFENAVPLSEQAYCTALIVMFTASSSKTVYTVETIRDIVTTENVRISDRYLHTLESEIETKVLLRETPNTARLEDALALIQFMKYSPVKRPVTINIPPYEKKE